MNNPTENAKNFFKDLADMNQHDLNHGSTKVFNVTARDCALHPILTSLKVERVYVNHDGSVQFENGDNNIVNNEKPEQAQEEMDVEDSGMDTEIPIDFDNENGDDDDDFDHDDETDDNRVHAQGSSFYIPTNLPSGQNHPAYVPLKVLSDKLVQIDWKAELENHLKANSTSLTCPSYMLESLLAQAVQKVRASLWTEIAGQQAPVL